MAERETSKLERRLDFFKHPVSGNIEISPRVARSILLESLLAYYRGSVVGSPNVDVEALAQIAMDAGDEDKLVDYTEARRKLVDEAERERKAQEEREFGEGGLNVIRPTPRVREI